MLNALNSNHQHRGSFQAVMPERDTSGEGTSEPCVFLKDWELALFFFFFAINLGRKVIYIRL